MADSKIQFPAPSAIPFVDGFGQVWIWNDVAWVRKGLEPGIEEAPQTNQQYARIHYYDKPNPLFPGTIPDTDPPESEPEFIPLGGEWELVQADEWYLGAHETPPTTDSYGRGLVEGHTYYDMPTHTMFVYDRFEWDAFSGVSEIATLWEYRWDSLGIQIAPFILDALNPIVPDPADPTKPAQGLGDDHGNIPFDQWVQGLIVVSVYKDGIRLIEKRELTPAYEDMPGRPSDEENQENFTTYQALLTAAPVDTTKAYYITTDGDIDVPTPGAGTSKKDFTYRWDDVGLIYVRGGVELKEYDYSVDYPNQEITFLHDLDGTETIVVETGTLAASQYIKTTYKNAHDWEFVNSDCDMGGETPDGGKLVTEDAIACFVRAEVEKGLANATNALIGSIFSYAGTTPPTNALLCDGQEVSKEGFPKLYARLGSTWDTFNGATPPDNNNFRVPPQEVNGFPLYYAGTMGATPIGSYLPGRNKNHSHTLSHSHTGTVSSSTGAHDHWVYSRTAGGIRLGGGKTLVNEIESKADYDAGRASNAKIHHHKERSGSTSAADAGSSVNISTSNAGTSSNGGATARPDTVITLMCIWADIQD